ncbi:peptidase M23 [Rhodococcus aetherivorans]|uniref:CIS tube protein n=1 Tax=Rhodococcus aetherivorans TaxID=191292 RepID=UPI003673ADA6
MSDSVALTKSKGAAADDGGAQVQHAQLQTYETKSVEGGALKGAPREVIEFQFNPKDVSITKSAKWESKPAKKGAKAPPPEFISSDPCKLTLEMFFDATASRRSQDVVASVERLLQCCVPTDKDAKGKPPLVVFAWGSVTSFPAYVTQVGVKYTLFAADGTPLRAVCNVSLEEMPGVQTKQNPTSGALVAQHAHTFTDADTLMSLAYTEYGDPNLWRALARHNDIDDPMRISAGTVIALPAAEELVR